jgi:cysteine-rich repeat protein
LEVIPVQLSFAFPITLACLLAITAAGCGDDVENPNCGDSKIYSGTIDYNGMRYEVTEACDDGNTVGGDGCSANCLSNETCGNGYVDTALPGGGEACDDGNTVGGDGCSADCRSNESCGNGIRELAFGEVCDDGNTVDGDGCSADCGSLEKCGDGVLHLGEMCDDNNTEGGDGCSADCRSNEICGNGVVDNDPALGLSELCDEGGNAAGCDADCTPVLCGDSFVNDVAGEQCDDGNTDDGDTCRGDCLSDYTCPNGVLDVDQGEMCDEGGNAAGCDADCTPVECGDMFVNPAAGEDCDNGGFNAVNCDGDCTAVECGDGYLNPVVESCDDGNIINGDGCDADCNLE